MKAKTYTTLQGLFKASNNTQLRCNDIINGRIYIGNNTYISLTCKGYKQFVKLLSEYLYDSKSSQQYIYNELLEGSRDRNNYLQCFYLSKGAKGYYISNSLSGEAFEYCRRNFKKSL